MKFISEKYFGTEPEMMLAHLESILGSALGGGRGSILIS